MIDYRRLVVASGTLPQVVISEATVLSTGINVTYQTNLLIPKVKGTDQVVLIAKTQIGELLVSKQLRGSEAIGTISIAYPGILVSDVKCCYLFVRNADGSKSSKSVYVTLS